MPDVETLLAEFAAAWDAGMQPDPNDSLAKTESDQERIELSRELELFLEIAPAPSYSEGRLAELRASDDVGIAGETFRALAGGRKIADARRARGLSLAELAKRLLSLAEIEPEPAHLGAAEAHLSSLETGRSSLQTWSKRARQALSQILGTDLTPPRPAGALLRAAAGATDGDLLAGLELVADALESSALPARRPDDPVDQFIHGTGSAGSL